MLNEFVGTSYQSCGV
jgi:hypothetical protein